MTSTLDPSAPDQGPASGPPPLGPSAARIRGFPGAARPAPSPKPVSAAAPIGGAPPSRSLWNAEAGVPTRLVHDRRSNRWLGLIFLVLLAAGGYGLYRAVHRPAIYGLVTARIQRVPAPFDGTLISVHVREGDDVRAGDTLGQLENLATRHQLDQLHDELSIQRATLDAEVAQMRLNSQLHGDRYRKSLAEFYELWGTYLEEAAQLEVLKARQQRYQLLRSKRVLPEESLETLQLELEGQRVKVEKLRIAVEQLRTRAAESKQDPQADETRLKPVVARIESLQEQIKRLRSEVELGEVRATVSGRVVKVHHIAGEYLEHGACFVELRVQGTLHPILYVTPRHAQELQPGRRLSVTVLATREKLDCVVKRIQESYEDMPTTLSEFLRFDRRALPVELEPLDSERAEHVLTLGGAVVFQPTGDHPTVARPEVTRPEVTRPAVARPQDELRAVIGVAEPPPDSGVSMPRDHAEPSTGMSHDRR